MVRGLCRLLGLRGDPGLGSFEAGGDAGVPLTLLLTGVQVRLLALATAATAPMSWIRARDFSTFG
jgi:hypothetical protein